jgi:hypothetical protein
MYDLRSILATKMGAWDDMMDDGAGEIRNLNIPGVWKGA